MIETRSFVIIHFVYRVARYSLLLLPFVVLFVVFLSSFPNFLAQMLIRSHPFRTRWHFGVLLSAALFFIVFRFSTSFPTFYSILQHFQCFFFGIACFFCSPESFAAFCAHTLLRKFNFAFHSTNNRQTPSKTTQLNRANEHWRAGERASKRARLHSHSTWL